MAKRQVIFWASCVFVFFSCGKKDKKLETPSVNAHTTFSFARPFIQNNPQKKSAIFAGGCFWCMESPFENLVGVDAVILGYTGGSSKNPTYNEVSYGDTGHVEASLVVYDPKKISYEKLLDTFWKNINPEQDDGQFYDKGDQYKTVIFYQTKEEKGQAEKSLKYMAASGKFTRIAVKIKEAGAFWPAEDFHQGYYKKNPESYAAYVNASGRKAYLKSKWENSPNKN